MPVQNGRNPLPPAGRHRPHDDRDSLWSARVCRRRAALPGRAIGALRQCDGGARAAREGVRRNHDAGHAQRVCGGWLGAGTWRQGRGAGGKKELGQERERGRKGMRGQWGKYPGGKRACRPATGHVMLSCFWA
eukprot:360517-Chlamydomonas_euryale.AAC.6